MDMGNAAWIAKSVLVGTMHVLERDSENIKEDKLSFPTSLS
jgi:hypothetical protein